MKSKLYLKSKERERERAIEAGFYDGRFKTKIVKDKKKELSKTACKKKDYETY